ncbi:hypothetical protein QS286_26965, partial [Escherichia coli]|nr:hypothetical protein [Escherichia coli]
GAGCLFPAPESSLLTVRPASASVPAAPVTCCAAALPASLPGRPDLAGKGRGAGRGVTGTTGDGAVCLF